MKAASSGTAVVASDEGNRRILTDTFRSNVVQQRFFAQANRPYSKIEEVLFDGSIRLGKTYAACKLITAWAMKWRGTYVISRFTYPELEESTKKVFLYGDGDLPAACPYELWLGGERGLNLQHNRLDLVSGSRILFRALEPTRRGDVRNITAAGWFIDQAEELEGDDIADFYMEIKGRCSARLGPKKMVLVANPGPTDHFLYKRFIDPVQKHPKTARVHGTIHDNAENLAPEYYQMLLSTKDTDPAYYARMVMGEWGIFTGKRFKMWNPRLHVVEKVFDIPSEWYIIEGGDYGWDHPTAWTWHAVDFEGRWWTVAEYAARETEVPDHARAIKQIRAGHEDAWDRRPFKGSLEPSASYLDPSAWAKKSEHDAPGIQFAQHGIYCAKAMNERIGGWSRMASYLNERMDDGYPRWRIFPTCVALQHEIANARIKAGTDDIEKRNDDHIDTARYAIMSQMPSPEEEEKEAEWKTREAHAASVIKNKLRGYEERDRSLAEYRLT